ncbi:MAG: hypothetical protein JRJ85_21250 [Deltaproteobacteria bacterium]|nr:hypothetical protein [Deltaproteobacteria bacterium]
MENREKRREDRATYETDESAFVEFKVKKDTLSYKHYDLKVNDCSKYGLGILIPQKDMDILQLLKRGDQLQNMTFFSFWTVLKVNGTVQHQTEITAGQNKGCYIIGIKSDDRIEHCKAFVH